MRYRLIRFSANGEVELDQKCVTPNQFGCNREWLTNNPDGKAVLLERGKFSNGVSYLNFYAINPEVAINKSLTTWIAANEDVIMRKFKYLEMLKLTGAL